jgi:hypothetical protein
VHVLFVHKNFPAQFGHIGSFLAREHGWKSTFVSEKPPETAGGAPPCAARDDADRTILRGSP